MLVALEERSLTPDGGSGRTSFIGCLVNNKTPPPPGFFATVHSRDVKVLCFEAVLKVLIPEGLLGWRDSGKSTETGRAGRGQRDVPRISQPMIAQELRHVKDILQTAGRSHFQ